METLLQYCTPVFRNSNLIYHLRTLYAQSCWITLAPSVLPRLLAQSWSELFQSLSISLHCFGPVGLYDITVSHPHNITESGLRPLLKIPHCCPQRGFEPFSVPMWLCVLSDQLVIDSLVSLYLHQQLNHWVPLFTKAS